MKPALVAIFAHPDDEAFGPAGTLALLSKTHDIHIICATRGEAGENHLDEETGSIGEIREQELRKSAALLGATQVHFLDYEDGTICNKKYHEMADKIHMICDPLQPEILMTYENRGVSGHLDHVAVSMITHFVFHQVPYAKKLMSYALSREMTNNLRDYFIYVPHGCKRTQMDEIVDITPVWDLKKRAVQEHRSQKKDISKMMTHMEAGPKEEYFFVQEK